MASLPLFPLGGALLPGARMPLQLFEPRYLALAQRLSDEAEDERRFGIVLIRRGHEVGTDRAGDLHAVGCEALVDAMALARGAQGTVVHLVARGGRRFRLEHLDADAGTPYLTGEVTWLEEPTLVGSGATQVDALARSVIAAHARYLETLGASTEPIEAQPQDVAYRVVERMVLDPADRQRVLDGADPVTRLRVVRDLLRRETAIVGEFGALPTPPEPGGAALN